MSMIVMGTGLAAGWCQSSGVLPTALDFVDPGKVLAYWNARFDVAHSSNRVSAWGDQFSGGFDNTQGTGANQPLYNATGGPNNHPIVSLDSTARFMASALNTPVRTTAPTTMWLVCRQVTWVTGKRILDSTDTNKKTIYQEGTTPQIDLYDGGSVGNNAGATVGSFARILADWTVAAAGCRLDAGASNVTGLNPGIGTANVGREIGKSGSASAVVDFCEVLFLNAALSTGAGNEEDDLDTIYIPAVYGVGNVLV
jgi:hypothetical protein